MKQQLEAMALLSGLSLATAIATVFVPGSFYQAGLMVGCLTYAICLSAPFLAPNKIRSYLLAIINVFALHSLIQTALYYLGASLSTHLDGWTVILASWTCYGVSLLVKAPSYEKEEIEPPSKKNLILAILACIAVASLSFILFSLIGQAATTETIRSPWLIIPAGSLCLFGFIIFNGFLLEKTNIRSAAVIALGLILGLIFSIAPLVYPLGFGFDGFLHRASEKIILQTGTLTPKPFYYIGQYTSVTWLVRLFDLPLKATDFWFTPLLGLFLLPLSLSWKEKKLSLISAVILLPLAGLIGSTPQATAYIVGISALILAWQYPIISPSSSLILGLWSIAIHPLAGLPFFFASLAILFRDRSILRWTSCAFAILIIPLAFFVLSLRPSTTISWHSEKLFNVSALATSLGPWFIPPLNHVALWADWASWTQYLLSIIIVILMVIAWKDVPDERKTISTLTTIGLALAFIALIMKAMAEFNFLIDYERQNYIDRLLVITQGMLFLPACMGWKAMSDKIERLPRLATLGSLFMFSLMGAGMIYNAYPKHDAATIGRGWSVGIHDIEAVRYIDQDAQGKPYTVLANQSVSAAAVEQFGFKRYAGDVFFYPIPTGGPLYELFLKAAQANASRDTIAQAAKLGQSELVYIVLDHYWWDADSVAEQLTSIADKSQTFGNNNDVIVYRFNIASNPANQ